MLYLMIVNNPTSDTASSEPRPPHGMRQNLEEAYDWHEDPQLDYYYYGAPSGERDDLRDRHGPGRDVWYPTDNDGRFEQRVMPYHYQYQQDTTSSSSPRYNSMATRRETRPQNWDRNDEKEYCVTGV